MTDDASNRGVSATGATLPPDPHDQFAQSLVGSLIAGRYIVERVLGRGGMGLVVVARYPELEQHVAIKLMFPMLAADGVLSARFMREARVAAKVKSPHLVRVSDVGRLDTGVPYLVMELLSGHDLDQEITQREPLPFEEAVDFLLQACAGVAELHSLGIVHRDLKPSNLFLTDVAGERAIKILDFGISKDSVSTSGALTVTDSVIGTPSHMSPEQIKTPKEVDARADIWSLGVILYELITRRLPFDLEGESVGELFGHILFSEPVKPTARRADVPAGLEAIIVRCLRRDREERFADVGELAEALRPFAAASTHHRIDAVKKTLAASQRASARNLAASSSPKIATPQAKAETRGPLSEKATVPAGPRVAVSDSQRAADPANFSKDPAIHATAPNTQEAPDVRGQRVASSRSLATSSRSVRADGEGAPRRKLVIAIAAVGFVSVAAISFFALRGARVSPDPARAHVSAAMQSDPSASMSVTTQEPASIPSASEPSTAIVAPSATSSHVASQAGPPTPHSKPHSSAQPASAPPAVPHPPANPPATPSSSPLIMDRK